jgi:hypothetical protein
MYEKVPLASPEWGMVTAKQAAELLKIDYRKLALLVEQGIVQVESPGRGRPRMFGLREMVLIKAFSILDDLGLAPRRVRTIARKIEGFIRPNFDPELVIEVFLGFDGEPQVRKVQRSDDPTSLGNYVGLIINVGELHGSVMGAYIESATTNRLDGLAVPGP